MAIPRDTVIAHLKMKTRRAERHLGELESETAKWLKLPPYTVAHELQPNRKLEVWRIRLALTPDEIPMSIGDWVNCLRSGLDQFAWALAHLPGHKPFTEREEKQIHFLIFKNQDSTYMDRRCLFPSAVAKIFDEIQPYNRGNAFADDPLWQLNELWTLDKHRIVAVNSNSIDITFPWDDTGAYVSEFDDGVDVNVPLLSDGKSQVDVEPQISMQVLFGEYMGKFEVSLIRVREIHNIITNDVIPKFYRFFSYTPAAK